MITFLNIWIKTIITFVDTDVVVGELRDPKPGEPGDPGDPGFNEADEGGLDRLLLVEPEKASLKLGFCRPDKVDLPSTSLSSGSFTGDTHEWINIPKAYPNKWQVHKYPVLQNLNLEQIYIWIKPLPTL